jgi:hypothetical protein
VAVLVGAVAIAGGVAAALLFNASFLGPKVGDAAPSAAASAPARSVAPPPAPPPVSSPAAMGRKPVPSAQPSASVTATASAPGQAPDVAALRETLLRSLRVRDFASGEEAFLELVQRNPDALRDPEMGVAVRDLAVELDREGKADRLFDALTGRLGQAGLDVLYDLVATRGLASAALRAATVLRRKEVLARATPEMRVAFQLREAACVDKLAMLDRAAAEGDGRALVVLQTQGVACFKKNNKAVQEAMAALRSRLSRGQ